MGAESEAGLKQQLVDCIRMLAQSDIVDYLEENAYRQYMALQIGKPYAFTEQEVALCRGSSGRRASSSVPGIISGRSSNEVVASARNPE